MKKVLITGSAGGIGSATVAAFRKAGLDAIGLDRDPGDSVDGHLPVVVDLLDCEAVEGALGSIDELQHIVCVAGGALAAEKRNEDPAMLPIDAWRASVEQNLTSAFITVRAALPALRRAEGDRSISVVSSTDALLSTGLVAYSAAKAGLVGMVRALAGPLGAEGIRINAIAPGDVVTPRNAAEWEHIEDWYQRLTDATALKRLVTTAEVAEAVLALATSMTSLTGQLVVLDGGLSVNHVAAWSYLGGTGKVTS
ncbi:MAG: SDR family oxidoreductase [Actinobacteria bacterium]|nr:SDR family oxidoreductase [Actinomycetota bacterium]